MIVFYAPSMPLRAMLTVLVIWGWRAAIIWLMRSAWFTLARLEAVVLAPKLATLLPPADSLEFEVEAVVWLVAAAVLTKFFCSSRVWLNPSAPPSSNQEVNSLL